MACQTVAEPALVLSADDFEHLYSLLEGAQQALPNNTDALVSNACLRAALEFMRACDVTQGSEPGVGRAIASTH